MSDLPTYGVRLALTTYGVTRHNLPGHTAETIAEDVTPDATVPPDTTAELLTIYDAAVSEMFAGHAGDDPAPVAPPLEQ